MQEQFRATPLGANLFLSARTVQTGRRSQEENDADQRRQAAGGRRQMPSASQTFVFDAGGSNVVFCCWRRPPLHLTLYGYDASLALGVGPTTSLRFALVRGDCLLTLTSAVITPTVLCLALIPRTVAAVPVPTRTDSMVNARYLPRPQVCASINSGNFRRKTSTTNRAERVHAVG
jgi:hypothetical protein